MDVVTRARQTLQDAEVVLRGLLGEAASSSDYESLVEIATWARAVHELINAVPREHKKASPSSRGFSSELAKAKKAGSTHHASARTKRDDYPRFFRQDDQLVRIAWSKREKKEYRHKASYAALDALVTAMASKGAEGRVFSTDQLLPIHEPDGSEVPSYQSYVSISLLKQTGLIDQHGRQGYSIPRIEVFRDAVDAVWKKLPKH